MNKYVAFVLAAMVLLPVYAQTSVVSTSNDTKGVSLTVYNGGFAVVREKREMTLESGVFAVRYEDVAAQIDPTSIAIKSITDPLGFYVMEQNYQYDLLNPTSILNKSVGKTIRFRQVHPDGKVEIIEGTLLNPPTVTTASTDAGWGGMNYQGLVIRTSDGKLVLNPSGEILLDELPEGLVSKPSLLWLLNVGKAGKHNTEVSYMTNGITWKCDYVAVVGNDENIVDITGWVTIDNRSGGTYKGAELQLLAGDVRRVQDEVRRDSWGAAEMKAAPMGSGGFQEESFFEYHLYTLEGKTNVNNNETKQMTLMSANNVEVQRKLILDAGRGRYFSGGPGWGGDTDNEKLAVVLELKNTKANNMGMPLPKGKVRVYKADKRDNLHFLGEDRIDHTPKDELVKLHIGEAFDVVGERKRVNYRKISDRVVEEDFQVIVRNHKETPVKVWVVDRFWSDWKVTETSHKFTKLDASTVEYVVDIPQSGEVTLTYTVRTKW